jgi:hypothetical protein
LENPEPPSRIREAGSLPPPCSAAPLRWRCRATIVPLVQNRLPVAHQFSFLWRTAGAPQLSRHKIILSVAPEPVRHINIQLCGAQLPLRHRNRHFCGAYVAVRHRNMCTTIFLFGAPLNPSTGFRN